MSHKSSRCDSSFFLLLLKGQEMELGSARNAETRRKCKICEKPNQNQDLLIDILFRGFQGLQTHTQREWIRVYRSSRGLCCIGHFPRVASYRCVLSRRWSRGVPRAYLLQASAWSNSRLFPMEHDSYRIGIHDCWLGGVAVSQGDTAKSDNLASGFADGLALCSLVHT